MLYKVFLIYEECGAWLQWIQANLYHITLELSVQLNCNVVTKKNMHCPVSMSKCNTLLQSEFKVLSLCTQQSSTQKHFKNLIFVRKKRKIILW